MNARGARRKGIDDLDEFEDIEQSLYQWLPLISHHFPGIHPGTVYDLTLDWWRVYVAQAAAILKESEQKQPAQGSRRR